MESKKRAKPAPAPVSDLVQVEVIVAGAIHDGKGGCYPVGEVLSVPAKTAESLRRQKFAK